MIQVHISVIVIMSLNIISVAVNIILIALYMKRRNRTNLCKSSNAGIGNISPSSVETIRNHEYENVNPYECLDEAARQNDPDSYVNIDCTRQDSEHRM